MKRAVPGFADVRIDEMKWCSHPEFPIGPWKNEPDRVVWRDKATGLPCMIIRQMYAGALCGYVAVDSTHPLHGTDYQDVDDFSVHGGLTYSGECQEHICHKPLPGEPNDVWWFGFDCSHSGDLTPKEPYPSFYLKRDGDIYRDLPYVRGEVEALARQLHESTKP